VSLHSEFHNFFTLSSFAAVLSLLRTFLLAEYETGENDRLLLSHLFLDDLFYTASFVVSITSVYFEKSWINSLYVEDQNIPLRSVQILEFAFLFFSVTIPYRGHWIPLHNIVTSVGFTLSWIWPHPSPQTPRVGLILVQELPHIVFRAHPFSAWRPVVDVRPHCTGQQVGSRDNHSTPLSRCWCVRRGFSWNVISAALGE
jgi:hypothetical protein